jgi:hypothetical protein
MNGMTESVSVLLMISGSALRARIRTTDMTTAERALTIVRNDAATALDPLYATSAIQQVGEKVEAELEFDSVAAVSRRGLRRIASLNAKSLRRLGYTLQRETVAAGGQLVSVYSRCHRGRA